MRTNCYRIVIENALQPKKESRYGNFGQESRVEWADTVKEFKQQMAKDSAYEDRHFRKVDVSYEHFLERITEADLQLPASVDQVP